RGIREFGAFVDLGGVDGLLHISQMSWARVKHPADLLQEGQKINVKIQKIDPDTGKIALSLRDLQSDPWSNVNSHYPVGTVCRGVVTKIMQYGAFVQLEAGLEGMIHISEIDYARVAKIEDYIKEGQEVEVKVLQIDFDKRRIALSRKQCLQKPAGPLGDPRYMAPIEEDVPEEPAPDRRNKKRNQPLRGGTTRDESRSDGGWI
ncbi:MAG TPA: S1 RNA-binding domain-containing protein, partial [Pirellulales bacterium]